MIALDQSAISAVSNRDFLAQAFHHCGPDEAPWVTGFPGDPGSVEPARWAGRSALPLPSFIRDDHNNYVVVSVFRARPDGRVRRRKDQFAAMSVIMVDDVETSPGNFQAWYFLTEPERDRPRAEALIKGMIASGLTADGADPGMNGVTRYGRLPVGINGKSKYHDAHGKPFVQRVAHWNPATRYRLDDIAQAYGVDMSAPVLKARRRGAASNSQIRTQGANDGFVQILASADLYVAELNGIEGAHLIVCPWVHEHTDQDTTGTVYFEPSEENFMRGGFKCHHGHCQGRTIADLNHFVVRLLQMQKEQ
jgi:hypothetical protein